MSIKNNEINKVIEKLRDKYGEYSKKYSKKWFDIGPFEERLKMAVDNKMNMEGFILAEITNFEKIKEKYEKQKEKHSFSQKVDDIILKNLERIKKYPEIKFHPAAGIEIRHFYGAISDLFMVYYPMLWVIIKDVTLRKAVSVCEERLSEYAQQKGKMLPPKIEDHILLLQRRDVSDLDVEKSRNIILKETAFILHDINRLLDAMLEIRDDEWETPVRFDRLFVEGDRKKKVVDLYKGCTGYGVILKIKEYISSVIDDFRLGAFQRKDPV